MSTIGYYICVPFAWVLRTFYELTGSYGWALVLFTLVVKLITLPFQMKSKKSMMRMNLFQPKIKEIQTKYANNPQKMNDEIQMLYAKEGVNPMSGCLWSFLPFPILIALYSIIRQPLSRFMMLSKDVVTEITTLATTLGYNAELVRKGYEEIGLAKFISDNFADFSGKFDGLLNVNYNFLGLDLTVMPGDVWKDFFTGGWPVIGVVLIPFISGALSLQQSKVSMSGNVAAEGNDAAARSNRMMMWMMPLMSLWIGFTLPAALGVYWIVNSLLYAIQEKVLTKYYKSHMEDELSEKEKQKRDDRLRRMEAAREQQRKYAAEEAEKKVVLANTNYTEVAAGVLKAIGGKENVSSVDYCATRLRFTIKDYTAVDEKAVKAAGAAGVIRPSKNACQVIIGTKVQFVYAELKKMLCSCTSEKNELQKSG